MPANRIYPLSISPGIQRDGTQFSSSYYIDGQWVRFYRGLPEKMGGYFQLIGGLPNIVRGTFVIPDSPNFNCYLGDYQSLKYFPFNSSGTLGSLVDRTPSLFNANLNNQWKLDSMYSDANSSSVIIAHAAQNVSAIDNIVNTPVYYGDSISNSPLVNTGISVSGGIVVLHPYLFAFGNAGEVMWSNANDPTTIMDSARVTAQKIVAGFATRGGNSSPAGLLWSLDSLIRVTQVGTSSVEFAFDTVTSQSSILSSKGIVEYDGTFYWAGVDRFLLYNGVVEELPNSMSLEYFFGNLNLAQRQKVWAAKYPRKGEIWFHFPNINKPNNTECNDAVIFNVRENAWYDTLIQRSSGYFDPTFAYPVWSDNIGNGPYGVWMHETGFDQNVNNTLTAIDSYFQTGNIAWVGYDPNQQHQELDKNIYVERIEPDFIQQGEMTVTVHGRQYARSPDVPSISYPFSPTDVKVNLRQQRREMTLLFESNTIGGYYEMGQTLIVFGQGDVRA